jgi:hypothetical protein
MDVEEVISCVIVTVIPRVLQLLVVMTCEYQINRFTNPKPIYKSLINLSLCLTN